MAKIKVNNLDKSEYITHENIDLQGFKVNDLEELTEDEQHQIQGGFLGELCLVGLGVGVYSLIMVVDEFNNALDTGRLKFDKQSGATTTQSGATTTKVFKAALKVSPKRSSRLRLPPFERKRIVAKI